MEYKISYFKSIADKSPSEISILELLEAIKTGKFKGKIDKLRKEAISGKRDLIKRSLPAVTISGIFKNGHKAENLVSHSGLIQIDLDKVKDLPKIIETLKNDKYTFACFTSPSGNGIKVIVKIQTGISLHIQQFKDLEHYYLKTYSLKIDQQCKDVTRLMFVSFDENLSHNPDSIQWGNDYQNLFQEILKQINKYENFNEGNRNKYVFKLACKCREKEIPFDYTLKEIINKYKSETFLENEITNTVKSSYNNSGKTNNGNIKEEIDSPEKEINTSKFYAVISYLKNNFVFRFNEVLSEFEFREKDKEQFETLNEYELYTHLRLKSINISMNDLLAILRSKFVEHYNPFKNYFESLSKWDGIIDHISRLCNYITAVDQERFNKHLKKALVRCIACSLGYNFNKHAFIIVGGQNGGKSTFIRNLCPSKLKDYYSENISTDKDGLISLCENIIINLDELAALQKTEINALKNILSKDAVKVRKPYDKKQTVSKRRANFFGSTNKDEFLTDETGSVRWLCFEIIKIDWNYVNDVDIDLVWAQAYTLLLEGFKGELSSTEIEENEEANSNYQQRTSEMELIQKHFAPATKNDEFAEAFTATDVLENLQKKTTVLNNSSSQKIGKALAELGFEKVSERIGDSKMPKKVYWVKLNA